MICLGVHTSHDSGACVIEDGRILAAVNEERLVREKLYWGLPKRSIQMVLQLSGKKPEDIDLISVGGVTPGAGGTSETHLTHKVGLKRKVMDVVSRGHDLFGNKFVLGVFIGMYKRFPKSKEVVDHFRSVGLKAPVEYIEHHEAHAASAFYTSPFGRDTLVVTIDASGDGICSSINIIDSQGALKRVASTPFIYSPASIYAYVTSNLGYKTGRHEGKITGLAAYGDPGKTYGMFRDIMGYQGLEFRTTLKAWGRPAARILKKRLEGHKPEDIAAGLQKRFEEVIVAVIQNALKVYPRKHVALAGGAFANVKLNQRIAEIRGVESIFIHPHMGDGGLGCGAALASWASHCIKNGKQPRPIPIQDVYLGPSYGEDEIRLALGKQSLSAVKCKNPAKDVARLLSEGKIVGIFNNRMEYGPRALGARTILASAGDKSINDWLNKRLKRTEFMPFAPVTRKEDAAALYKNFPKGEVAAQFMTVTFDVDEEKGRKIPAVVHVDGTARPQTITREQNRLYYDILTEYCRLTGISTLINTSFNMHEEPIVCSPEDAIRSFLSGSTDYLLLEDLLVKR
jgi:carbamoyltransferase